MEYQRLLGQGPINTDSIIAGKTERKHPFQLSNCSASNTARKSVGRLRSFILVSALVSKIFYWRNKVLLVLFKLPWQSYQKQFCFHSTTLINHFRDNASLIHTRTHYSLYFAYCYQGKISVSARLQDIGCYNSR